MSGLVDVDALASPRIGCNWAGTAGWAACISDWDPLGEFERRNSTFITVPLSAGLQAGSTNSPRFTSFPGRDLPRPGLPNHLTLKLPDLPSCRMSLCLCIFSCMQPGLGDAARAGWVPATCQTGHVVKLDSSERLSNLNAISLCRLWGAELLAPTVVCEGSCMKSRTRPNCKLMTGRCRRPVDRWGATGWATA
jgi:hypothetical protein